MVLDKLIIREATLEDIPEVAILHVDSWYKTYKGIIEQEHLDNMKNNLDKRIERMKNEFNLRKMIVVILDNEIIAFSEFTLTNEFSKDLDIDCELCGLYIKNEYLGKGIGSKVFDYVKSTFVKNNKKKMGLWCVKENNNAINFYVKKGGIQVKEKPFTLAGKDYSELAFVYNL
ncbi:MAG: GNAT family N-acetyltransferase [Clostridia bacterium]|nr:GNAT family N-acetyltransferase [Clostridia bacterium]